MKKFKYILIILFLICPPVMAAQTTFPLSPITNSTPILDAVNQVIFYINNLQNTLYVDINHGGNGVTSLPRIPAGTNQNLPSTNYSPTKPVQYSRISHYAVSSGGNVEICYANWQTASTGEQLANTNMQTWNHYTVIEYRNNFYPVRYSGVSYGVTTNGGFVCSDPIVGLHLSAGDMFYEFHAAVPANYRAGPGVPSSTLGSNGDTYYDNVARKWYSKSAGSWGGALGSDPWLTHSPAWVVPVTHYTRGAFGEFGASYQGDDATLTHMDGSYARGAVLNFPNISSGTLTFSGITILWGGYNYGWEAGNFPNFEILDLSEIGPSSSPACGTVAAGFGNQQAGSITSLTATQGTGSTYTGPLAIGFGVTNAAWGASAISMVPDISSAWVLLQGDSIISGWGSYDGDGEQYRHSGIYERSLSFTGIPPTTPSMNWGVVGLTCHAMANAMKQSQALFQNAFSTSNSNTLIACGSNDYLTTPISTVKADTQTTVNFWKNTAGFRHIGLATILTRTNSTDSWATETNQTPINAAFSSNGDVSTENSQIIAGSFVTGTDWVFDLRSWQQGSNNNVWKVSGKFTQSANSCNYPPTTDGIHPSPQISVYSSQVNAFPSLSP